MKAKETVTVQQKRGDTQLKYYYRVLTTKNTTDPKVGESLTEHEVQTLIQRGVTVNVK